MPEQLLRGDVWMARLDPTQGHEQAGTQPVLILSDDVYNSGPAGLVLACPLTSRLRPLPHHLEVQPPEGGVSVPSNILCDGLRSLAKERLLRRIGRVSPETMVRAGEILRILLTLP